MNQVMILEQFKEYNGEYKFFFWGSGGWYPNVSGLSTIAIFKIKLKTIV